MLDNQLPAKWEKVNVLVAGLETTLEFFAYDKGVYLFYTPQSGLIYAKRDKEGNYYANPDIVDKAFVAEKYGVNL